MDTNTRRQLIADLTRDEGTGPVRHGRLMPYFDCCGWKGKTFRECTCTTQGKLSIGIGRNIEDIGISLQEAQLLLRNNLEETEKDLARHWPWYTRLSPGRQRALANFHFNVGPGTFRDFTATLGLLARGDFAGAAAAFRTNRNYFRDVGPRAERIAVLLEHGDRPPAIDA